MRRRASYHREIMSQTFTESHSQFWRVPRLAYYILIRILTVHVDLILVLEESFVASVALICVCIALAS